MRTLWRRWSVWRALRRALADDRQIAHDNANLREQLEEEKVRSRILQVEVDLLTAVHARDLARWQSDTPAIRDGAER